MSYFTRSQSVFFLSFFMLLERFCYYGVRAVIILYLIDVDGLAMDNSEAYGIYGWFTFFITLLPLPFGAITDAVLKQKNAIVLGSILSFLGYACFMFLGAQFILIGAILIVLGTSFIRVNVPVLLGRLYHKLDKERNKAFLINLLFVNIGSASSIMIVGYIGEKTAWINAFIIVATVALLFTLLFWFIKDRLAIIESNYLGEEDPEISPDTNSEAAIILDYFAPERNIQTNKSILLVVIFSVAVMLFWWVYEVNNNIFYQDYFERVDFSFFGSRSAFAGLFGSGVSLFFSFLLLIYLSVRKNVSTTLIMVIALFAIGGVSFLTYMASNIPESSLFYQFIIIFVIMAFAETLISVFAISYITRISKVEYSSTIYGLYLFIVSTGSMLFGYLNYDK